MNRRGFLKRLGLGAAALVAAPVLGANYSQLVPAEPKVMVSGWRPEPENHMHGMSPPFEHSFDIGGHQHWAGQHTRGVQSLSITSMFLPDPVDPLTFPDYDMVIETADGRRYTGLKARGIFTDPETARMEIEFNDDKLGGGLVRGIWIGQTITDLTVEGLPT